jgi:hypothetical protein
LVTKEFGMQRVVDSKGVGFTVFAGALVAMLMGCAAPAATEALPVYRCEHNIDFTARFVDDSVLVRDTRGQDVLYRSAGQPPGHYSNPRMSAEFGLGASGREAILRYPMLPLLARCVRD